MRSLTIRPLHDASLARCVSCTMRPLHDKALGRCDSWMIRPLDDASPCDPSIPGLMCPRPMCPRPKILGCCAPWTKRPLDTVSLTEVSRPWNTSSMELAPSAAIAASVDLRHLMDQWGVWPVSPTPLTRFIELAPLRRMHARPTHRTPPLRSAKARDRDGMARSGAK
jgi:hypothetical protein